MISFSMLAERAVHMSDEGIEMLFHSLNEGKAFCIFRTGEEAETIRKISGARDYVLLNSHDFEILVRPSTREHIERVKQATGGGEVKGCFLAVYPDSEFDALPEIVVRQGAA